MINTLQKLSREKKAILRFNLDLQEMDGYMATGTKASKSMKICNRGISLAMEKLLDFKGKSIVDIGCGDGTYSIELITRMKAASVLGIEPSDGWKVAGKKYSQFFPKARFQHGSAYNLEFPNKHFDVAIMRGVLHHLDNPLNGLKEAFRVSKETLVTEPNGYNAVIKLLEIISPYHRRHGERSLSPAKLRKAIRSLGGRLIVENFSGIVPLFCPDAAALFLDWLSSKWEAIPFIPKISCGVYLVLFAHEDKNMEAETA